MDHERKTEMEDMAVNDPNNTTAAAGGGSTKVKSPLQKALSTFIWTLALVIAVFLLICYLDKGEYVLNTDKTGSDVSVKPSQAASGTKFSYPPSKGMQAPEWEIKKWTWQGTDYSTCKKKTAKYSYQLDSYSFNIWIDDDNIVQKADYGILGKPDNKKTDTQKKPEDEDDPYDAKGFMNPDDFYYAHYDDFWDYDEAEEYWEDHQ